MAARGQFNAKSPTIKRILREAAELSNSPSPDFTATPQEDNLFEWHFTLRGPPGNSTTPESSEEGPYAQGIYHGRIVLPPTYPLRPPSFRFLTPSGRFETNREICLSISGHHEETWQPAWGLRTALVALRTFMETDAKGQLGGLDSSDAVRRRVAMDSRSWKCSTCLKTNSDILAECEEASKLIEAKAEVEVPKELKMGFKDEMESKRDGEASDTGEGSELAEGFVQTVPVVTGEPATATEASPLSQSETYPPARPAQGVPRPTATIPLPAPPQAPLAPLAVQGRHIESDGIPAWVDKAILGVVACLVAVVLKLILGL